MRNTKLANLVWTTLLLVSTSHTELESQWKGWIYTNWIVWWTLPLVVLYGSVKVSNIIAGKKLQFTGSLVALLTGFDWFRNKKKTKLLQALTKEHSPNIWLFLFCVLAFLLDSFFTIHYHVLLTLCICMQSNRAVNNIMQGRQNKKFPVSAKYYIRFVTVFHILYFSPLHLSLCLHLWVISKSRFGWRNMYLSIVVSLLSSFCPN